jgi:hypothetical protein
MKVEWDLFVCPARQAARRWREAFRTSFIKAVVPMRGHRLFMDMESGSSVIVDLSDKLDTVTYGALRDDRLFRTVRTDGDYVIWGNSLVKVTARVLLDVALVGEPNM